MNFTIHFDIGRSLTSNVECQEILVQKIYILSNQLIKQCRGFLKTLLNTFLCQGHSMFMFLFMLMFMSLNWNHNKTWIFTELHSIETILQIIWSNILQYQSYYLFIALNWNLRSSETESVFNGFSFNAFQLGFFVPNENLETGSSLIFRHDDFFIAFSSCKLASNYICFSIKKIILFIINSIINHITARTYIFEICLAFLILKFWFIASLWHEYTFQALHASKSKNVNVST